ncbi:hypothetical protein D3880_07125 [Pseudomonas cavernae]|uniref:Uncharacterized protein n=1 Tax=Pseudomonas cavernae TaxID=2320867 RepID=A0A385YZH5_9PSED|nr:hypothetical protein [Pseudomonas cavernae]AYC32166.1 hypothetical protein D3880_07125 [Pseudomonas cavernae]
MTQAHDQLIGNVPSRISDTARLIVTPYEGRVAEYNIAAWLHLPGLANLPVSLLVSYEDGGVRREATIDHGKVNAHNKILLSGVARLAVKQKVKDMQVQLRSAVAVRSLIVEELFVQPVEQASSESQQALA